MIRYGVPRLEIIEETHLKPNEEAVSGRDLYLGKTQSGRIVVRRYDLKKNNSASGRRRIGIECAALDGQDRCFADIQVRQGAYFALPFLIANREGTKVAIGVSDAIEGKAEAVVHVYEPADPSRIVVLPPTAELSRDVLSGVALSADGDLVAASYLGSESKGTSGWLLWSASGALLQSSYGERVHEITFSPDGTKLAAIGVDAVHFYRIEGVPADRRQVKTSP